MATEIIRDLAHRISGNDPSTQLTGDVSEALIVEERTGAVRDHLARDEDRSGLRVIAEAGDEVAPSEQAGDIDLRT